MTLSMIDADDSHRMTIVDRERLAAQKYDSRPKDAEEKGQSRPICRVKQAPKMVLQPSQSHRAACLIDCLATPVNCKAIAVVDPHAARTSTPHNKSSMPQHVKPTRRKRLRKAHLEEMQDNVRHTRHAKQGMLLYKRSSRCWRERVDVPMSITLQPLPTRQSDFTT